MRFRAIAIAGLWLGLPAVAHADSAAELQTKGQQLAKDGRYSEAIDAFKAADRIEPRASHACLIALAYTRRELWPEAEIFMDQCHKRANASDPEPDWVPEAEKLITQRLASVNVASVDIRTDPVGASAKITVSSFAPDEVFEPRTIHLPPGHHTLIATAPGFDETRYELDVPDRTPQHVVIKLQRPGDKQVAPTKPVVVENTHGRGLMIAGGAALGAGVVAYGVMGLGWLKLRKGDGFGGGPEVLYDIGRPASIGFFALGAALLGAGIYVHNRHGNETTVSAAPLREGGGVVWVGWQR